MKYLESLNATFVIDTFLLLLIGVGPKIALVPFLDVTAGMSEATELGASARCSPPPPRSP